MKISQEEIETAVATLHKLTGSVQLNSSMETVIRAVLGVRKRLKAERKAKEAKITYADIMQTTIIRPKTHSKAPVWDGTFGIGEWEMRNGEKAIVDRIEPRSNVPLWGNGCWKRNGRWMLNNTLHELDLIRPWVNK